MHVKRRRRLRLRLPVVEILVLRVGIVGYCEEHADEPARGASAHAREEHVRQPPDVHAVLHRESLESLADVERVPLGVGEEQDGGRRLRSVGVGAEADDAEVRARAEALGDERVAAPALTHRALVR